MSTGDFGAHASLTAYFQEAVGDALRNQGVSASGLTEFYLVRLLSDFATASIGDAPLALQMAEAQMASPEDRARKLREIGDRSLYVLGFFADSLSRRLVDEDYYIRMGGTAYRQLARLPARTTAHFTEAWSELGDGFPRFVDVLAEVSELSATARDTDVMRLYQRWQRTGSPWLARRLRALGVMPGGSDVQ